ncbi:hypothetical protein SAMN05428988_2495 [Chitinophaga sp. YR573]|uniref:DUF6175 family protein n=1 Tax=Chitinophaga sp. YR573 TaxID=1881040 RepID=UPI0008C8BD73|nr:DUF6175 family protein [Chitinophaga sp. YR573]SEW14858.1 hypothetical protein SAMN05428988_2495 [Chitinophaga sp. YR573]
MKIQYNLVGILIFLSASVHAQDKDRMKMDRSQLSLIVVPIVNEAKREIENDYCSAISEINSALLKSGYKNTLDFKTQQENIISQRAFTAAHSKSDQMKIIIEKTPADICIETKMRWMDSPPGTTARQLQLSLKAVDKFTNAVYSDAILHSQQREFPGMDKAVETTLRIDGKDAFSRFLEQLDESYRTVLNEGRQVNMQFEVEATSDFSIAKRIGDVRLSEKIEDYVREKANAFKGQYKVIGESPDYMNILIQVPLIDTAGHAVTPGNFVGRGMDNYFSQLGLEVIYATKGTLLKYVLKQKSGK